MDKMLWIHRYVTEKQLKDGGLELRCWMRKTRKHQRRLRNVGVPRCLLWRPRRSIDCTTSIGSVETNKRAEEYVIAFQSIAYKNQIHGGRTGTRFIVGLKQEIRDRCLAAYPRPMGLAQWDISSICVTTRLWSHVKYSRREGQSSSSRGGCQDDLSSGSSPVPISKTISPPNLQQTFNALKTPHNLSTDRSSTRQRTDRSRMTLSSCGRFGHMEKDVKETRIVFKMWKGRTYGERL